jgi:hypothetical protein
MGKPKVLLLGEIEQFVPLLKAYQARRFPRLLDHLNNGYLHAAHTNHGRLSANWQS